MMVQYSELQELFFAKEQVSDDLYEYESRQHVSFPE